MRSGRYCSTATTRQRCSAAPATRFCEAEDDDRNGYVPNVVYTCGGMRVGDQLFMPYGISDSSIGFAFLPLKELVTALS